MGVAGHELQGERVAEFRIVDRDLPQISRQVAARRERCARHALDHIVICRTRELDAVLQHPACAIREPEFQTALQEKRSQDRNHDGRDRRQDREESDQPGVQLAAAQALPLCPLTSNAARVEDHQGDGRNQVAYEENGDQRR